MPNVIIAAAVSVDEDDALDFRLHPDVGHRAAVDRPLPPEAAARYQ
ncbi:hypothetical protein [Candidatus Accumulibacter phosphatis]|nr:hypothetical protein [Candidatus Accumulibacter phosphatis]